MIKVFSAAQVGSIISGIMNKVKDLIGGKTDEAPKDGKSYVRKDGAWVEADNGGVECASQEELSELLNSILGNQEEKSE